MKNTRWTILAALLLAATSVSVTHAQSQNSSGGAMGDTRGGGTEAGVNGGAPGGTATASSAGSDSGAVSNSQVTQTTTTSTSSEGIGPDGNSVEVDPSLETTELANTGGEPVLMSLLGLSMALGAFAVRKRVSA